MSGLNQLGAQAQLLQGLVSDHQEHRRGQGGEDAGGQPLGHDPGALLRQQLLERFYDGRSSLHLQETGEIAVVRGAITPQRKIVEVESTMHICGWCRRKLA